MRTCGDIDGKGTACGYHKTDMCPLRMKCVGNNGRVLFTNHTHDTSPACAPMVALVDERACVAGLRSEVIALTAWQHAHKEQFNAVTAARDEARAESAKWERTARAAFSYIEDIGTCSTCPCDPCPPGDPTPCGAQIANYFLALSAPQAQEEEG